MFNEKLDLNIYVKKVGILKVKLFCFIQKR